MDGSGAGIRPPPWLTSRGDVTHFAVVADVHGSIAALEAVVADIERQAPDLVLHGGDLVLHGPRPDAVVDRVRERCWPGAVGNTDELLWAPEQHATQLAKAPKLRSLLDVLFFELARATQELLDHERLEWLKELPRTWRDGNLAVVHAQAGDLWSAPAPDATDGDLLDAYGELDREVIVYGHIHRPFVRHLAGRVVANTGSVGLPYDGDPRASYLLVDDHQVAIRRVEYDVEQDAREMASLRYPRRSWLAAIRRSGRILAPAAFLRAPERRAGCGSSPRRTDRGPFRHPWQGPSGPECTPSSRLPTATGERQTSFTRRQ